MKRFNLNEFIWFFTLSLLMMIIVYSIISGNIYNILTERLVKVLWIAVVGIGALILVQIPKIFTIPDRGGLQKSNLIFILALFIMIIGVTQAPKVTLSKQVEFVVTEENHQHDSQDRIPDGAINVTDKNFYEYLEELQKDLDKFIDRDVTISGRIIKNNGRYLIIKNVMNCCAADAKTYGIFIDIKSDIQVGKEYSVTGKVQKTAIKYRNKEFELPIIKNVKILKIAG